MWQPWQSLRLLARKTLKVAKDQTLSQISSVFNIAKLVKTTFRSALKLRVILQSTIRSASTTTSNHVTSRYRTHHKAQTHTKNIDKRVFLPHTASPGRHPIQFPIKKQQNITAYTHQPTVKLRTTVLPVPASHACLHPCISLSFHSGAFAGCQKGFLSLHSSLASSNKPSAKIDPALRQQRKCGRETP